jgi:hypothetical protein
MGNTWTSADLINDILLLGHVPTGNNTFTPAKILRLATLELQTPVMKQILSTRGGYYLAYADQTVTADGLYPIPSDAIAGSLVNIELISGQTIIQCNLVDESEQMSTDSPTSTSYSVFMKGNFIQILPMPTFGTVRVWYSKRTSDLILTSAASKINAINAAVVTVSSIPSTITNGMTVDACGDQPPFNILGTRTITNITGTDITLDTAVDDLAVGDWLALEGQTPIPQIPVEYRVILAQRVVCKIYELQGYDSKMKLATMKLQEYEKDIMNLVTPRVKSQTKTINAIQGGFLSGAASRFSKFPAGA